MPFSADQFQHEPAEFIVGNIFADPDIAARLDAYNFEQRYPMGANPTCSSCGVASDCGKGCPAAVTSAGERIGRGPRPRTRSLGRLSGMAQREHDDD
jgi:radical SAM protein with 4Fe4S-binding SPASM domain